MNEVISEGVLGKLEEHCALLEARATALLGASKMIEKNAVLSNALQNTGSTYRHCHSELNALLDAIRMHKKDNG